MLLLAETLANNMQVADEVKFIKSVSADRILQLDELRSRMEQNISMESTQKKALEEHIQSSLSAILASDDSRRSFFQLSLDEDQQIVSVIDQFLWLASSLKLVFFLFSPFYFLKYA